MTNTPLIEVPFVREHKSRLICEICPVLCKLGEGQVGLCRGRKVIDGKMIATNYGETVALHLDPIEKKPLYHVTPGKPIWSVGPNGCNLQCKWCQNCEISQFDAPTQYYSPQILAQHAMTNGSVGLAYTYTEPLIWYEYLLDIMPEVKHLGGLNVLVTNGYVEEAPLRNLIPSMDAANVDLKFIDPELYRKYAGGNLETIQRTIRIMHSEGVHVELTHLIVTGLSDNLDHIKELVDWIAGVDIDIPLHLSRYSPRHRWDKEATSINFLFEAYRAAKKSLSFVYLGNIISEEGQHTFCPDCGKLVLERKWGSVKLNSFQDGKCSNCGRDLNLLENN
ncbi:MAG: AmmeMemoRadiSam system radical SAM enzyme [Candidatus Electryonea clarkiae]|nr:AmmeMemoRadiSam system radical SAM enzyme [Candidatus Electryonea clarkiae]MDP8287239.1 AmmeMemoRadiSam system radical SAM enzyme [Candidatus Electryonea clarkiae]